MTLPPILPSLAAAALILSFAGSASAASATEEDLAFFASTREQRPFSLSLASTSYLSGSPMFGIQASYHLSDRLALGAQATTAVMMSDLSANLRYFLGVDSTSGIFTELSAHALGAFGSGALGGVAELGYEVRTLGASSSRGAWGWPCCG